MQNFTFYNPTRIEFGKNKEQNIGRYMKEFGVKKTLIIYGSERIIKNGLFEVAAKSLAANGIEFCEIGGVKSNPVLSKVNEAINLARSEGVDSVLAIGGLIVPRPWLLERNIAAMFGTFLPAKAQKKHL